MAEVTSSLRVKLKAILDGLPAVPTNAQNAKALRQFIQMIDDMEVARINALVAGPSAKVILEEK